MIPQDYVVLVTNRGPTLMGSGSLHNISSNTT
jgi:hypothetical protein